MLKPTFFGICIVKEKPNHSDTIKDFSQTFVGGKLFPVWKQRGNSVKQSRDRTLEGNKFPVT